MAYEVVKTIRGREYRYRVQSDRDPATGKARNRWTYLGRVVGEHEVAVPRAPRLNARLRLLDATERLIERGEVAAITADAIAIEAGVAHGTFYRYFRDRSDVLEALARHLRATRAIADDQLLLDDVTSRDAARAGIRSLIINKLRFARERRTFMRTWYALVASDARLAAYREERRESAILRLREHLSVLRERGFGCMADSAATAGVLVALIEGLIRLTILEGDDLDDARIAAAADAAERAIFAEL